MTSELSSPFPPDFTISTPRLQITPFNPANAIHCAFLAQLWNTEDFINSCGHTSVDTPENASAFIRARILPDYTRNRHGTFLVSLRQDDKPSKPIGTVSLMKGAPPNPYYLAPDLGYAILPEESGKGYATEAAKGLLQYAREELGIEAVFGFCAAENDRSRRVLEKVDMEFRGVGDLKVFGGKRSAVYGLPGMNNDLRIYGLTEDLSSDE